MVSSKRTLAKVLTTLMLGSTCFSAAMANGDEKYLTSDPININGYVSEEADVTDAELENVNNELRKQKNAIIVNKEKKKKYNQLSRSTEKLADVTEEMIEERKESQQTIDRFNKKIDCLMAEGQKPGCEEFVKAPRQDKITVQQAAPVVAAPLPTPEKEPEFSLEGDIKVQPFLGLTTFISENENLEANSLGVKAEANVNSRLSVGASFNYLSMSTTDYGTNGLSGPDLNYYNNFYTGGREIEYDNMKFDLYAKYFLVEANRFRPYIGAGLGYNRTTIKYTDNRSAGYACNSYPCYGAYNNYNYGDEEVVTSNISLDAMLGTEIRFSERMGMNVEINYSTGLGGNLSSENGQNARLAPDQKRLEDLSSELQEAHVVSLFGGLLIHF